MTEPAAAAEARLSPTPLRGWPQRLLHLAALAVGWGLFVWAWHDVLGQHWEAEFLTWLVTGSLVILPTLTIAWVLHNVEFIAARVLGRARATSTSSNRSDWNGREVSADFAALARANVVVIDVEGKRQGVSGRRRPANRSVDRHAGAAPSRNRQRRPERRRNEVAGGGAT